MEEILQLRPEDFGTQNGIPYMRIRNLDGNQVKAESSERMLPLHPNLLDLGLMQLVELRKRQGQRRLFPHLARGATKGNFSELFTKNFGYYRKTEGVYWLGLDFHAFRTTFHGDLDTSGNPHFGRCAPPITSVRWRRAEQVDHFEVEPG